MKRYFIVFLCFLTIFLSSCSFNETYHQKTLMVVMPKESHDFSIESAKQAQFAIMEHIEKDNISAKLLTSENSFEQNNQLKQLINEKVDAILLWPHDGNDVKEAAQEIKNANIKLIIYDRLIDGFEPDLEVLGDNYQIGCMAGNYFNDYFKNEKSVEILEFQGDLSTVTKQRANGFYYTKDKKINIVKTFQTDWKSHVAFTKLTEYFNNASNEELKSLDAIYTHDDEVALGVLDAIKSSHNSNLLNIKLISGVGGRKENLDTFRSVKEELSIDQITYSFSPTMIKDAINNSVRLLNGEPLEKRIIVPSQLITNENQDLYRSSESFVDRYRIIN